MGKRIGRKRKVKYEKEEFQAYGEYTYDYLHTLPPQDEDADAYGVSALPPLSPAVPTPEMLRRAQSRRKSHVFFKILAVLAALTVMLVLLQETLFRLKVVYVIGNRNKTPQQVVLSSGLVQGHNMFSIREEDVRQVIAKDHTIIFKGMQKEYPSTIYLYIDERETVAVMQRLGVQYTLDAEGMVMTEEDTMELPLGLPVITGFRVSNINTGQQLMVRSERQIEAYQAIMKELTLQLYTDQVTEINLANPDSIYLITVEGITVRLGDSSYMQAKIGAIRTDMAYLRQFGKTSGVLDVTLPENAKFSPDN